MSEVKKNYGKAADVALIRDLSLCFGPTGCEDAVADMVERHVAPLADSISRDRMGNLVAMMRFGDPDREGRKRLMISAHMDEVGFMITELCDNGYLRFGNLGGIDSAVLAGRKVTLGDEINRISGMIASKAVHHKTREERQKAVPANKLYMDIGCDSKEESEKLLSVGAFGTFDSEFIQFGKDDRMVKCKALDDRMGCAAMIEVMRSLADDRPTADLDVFFCFTVREETGLSGAGVVANRLCPDYALVLETTAIGDIADAEPAARVADVGKGGVISLMDRSTIYNRSFTDFLLNTAAGEGIAAQVKRYVSGGNDAGHIHKSGIGVRAAALSVPTRYLHSPACVASLDDYEAVRDLSEATVRNIEKLIMEVSK